MNKSHNKKKRIKRKTYMKYILINKYIKKHANTHVKNNQQTIKKFYLTF